MNQQRELFAMNTGQNVGNSDRQLLEIVRDFENGEIQVPPFQRNYIWDIKKATGWIETVIDRQAIGVIVTYQLKGNGPLYIADGFQRLTATSIFLRNPSEYNFEFGTDQAVQFCKKFFITVQHRWYDTHDLAMQGFQNLNKGTSVSPAEFHKGHLTLDRQIGRKLYEEIPAILKRVEASWGATGKTLGRMQESKLLRDCFSLFYQFISGEKAKIFWNVGKIQEDITKSVEYMLLKYVKDWTHEKIDKEMKSFEKYLFSTRAIIYEILEQEKQSMGKSFSPALRRWLMHLNIWRKNNDRPVRLYRELIEKLIQTQRDYKSFTSRVLLPSGDFVTLGTDTLGHLHQLCRELDVPLYERRNRKSYPVAQGYDVSHKKPFSQYGEGDTFIEPSSINRARGDRLMSEYL